MVTRKKNGAPDPKQYEAAETIAKFEPVKQWLVKNCRKVCGKNCIAHEGGKQVEMCVKLLPVMWVGV